jgi:hypothetical protein
VKLSLRSPREAKRIISDALRNDIRGGPPANLAERARRLKTAGDPTRAVALVESETGMPRADAKKFVESLGA